MGESYYMKNRINLPINTMNTKQHFVHRAFGVPGVMAEAACAAFLTC